jgi:hypothetical protein
LNFYLFTILCALLFAGAEQSAFARNDAMHLSFEDVLNSPEAKGRLDSRVRFYLAGQKTPTVIKSMGSDVSNPKTNGFNKTAVEACHWAALSALIALQKRALQQGANAVIDIVSYYKKVEFNSATEYECHDGSLLVGVTLKGTFATLAD